MRVPKVSELPVAEAPDKVGPFRLLFDSSPEVTELNGRPLARNVQIWSTGGKNFGRWFLDGPSSGKAELARARKALLAAAQTTRFPIANVFRPSRFRGTRWNGAGPSPPGTFRKANALTLNGSARVERSLSQRAAAGWSFRRFDERWGVEREMSESACRRGRKRAPTGGAQMRPDATALDVFKMFEFSDLVGGPLPPETASVLLSLRVPF